MADNHTVIIPSSNGIPNPSWIPIEKNITTIDGDGEEETHTVLLKHCTYPCVAEGHDHSINLWWKPGQGFSLADNDSSFFGPDDTVDITYNPPIHQ
jgi:hypothetical protein